ncbi:hypothetical protein DYB28_009729 [Aphanomyces astaci]|uniref:Apple domain-containing protein n=1 Tax=Aphanomyces astaci TaxID=112090 RepID=A0A9X8DNV1_APHAT|nr:hypothetical protein DYB28_009729 [Aphanomyces astaci]
MPLPCHVVYILASISSVAVAHGCTKVFEPNTDYWGNDIGSTRQPSPSNCCNDCSSNPLCVLFVWHLGTCYLKNKQGPAGIAAGTTAGVVSPQCLAIEADTDYSGNDVASTHRVNARDCCADCNANPKCVVAVWHHNTCWLKGHVGAKSTLVGARAIFPRRYDTPPSPSPPQPTLQFRNRCSYPIELYKVDRWVCTLSPNGGGCDQWLSTGENPMFRHTRSEQATLVEFTLTARTLWFDVSVVPPNCRDGKSHDECLRNNGGRTGFNVPVSMTPLKYNHNPAKGNCRDITCLADKCPQAYVYPTDDLKMRDCPADESMLVTYCP